MSATEIFSKLSAAGVLLTVDAGRLLASPRNALTPELRSMIREGEADLIGSIARRRCNLLENAEVISAIPAGEAAKGAGEILEERPEVQRAIYADPVEGSSYMPVAFAVRGLGSIEVLVPKERFSLFGFLDLLSAGIPRQ